MPELHPAWKVEYSMPTFLHLNPADDILRDLVQRVPDVQTPVRIWRAIMQHEGLLGRALATLPFVEVIGASL